MAFNGCPEFSLPNFPRARTQDRLAHNSYLTYCSESGSASLLHLAASGRIVAAADRLDEKGLVSMIAKRGWDRVALISQICPANTPMGLCLKSQDCYKLNNWKLLFRTQVVGLVYPI